MKYNWPQENLLHCYTEKASKTNCCSLPPATATTESTEAPIEDLNDPHSNITEAL